MCIYIYIFIFIFIFLFFIFQFLFLIFLLLLPLFAYYYLLPPCFTLPWSLSYFSLLVTFLGCHCLKAACILVYCTVALKVSEETEKLALIYIYIYSLTSGKLDIVCMCTDECCSCQNLSVTIEVHKVMAC